MGVKASVRWQRAIVLLAALVAALGTARLGVWQLSRGAQKTALHDAIVQRTAMPPLTQAELQPAGADGAAQWHRRTEVAGRWLPRHTVFLDNRQMNGRPGFFVVTPLELAPGDALLVQRGWVPVDAADRTRLPALVTRPRAPCAWPAASPRRLRGCTSSRPRPAA